MILAINSRDMAVIFVVDLSYFRCLGLPAVTGANRNAWPPNLTSTAIIVSVRAKHAPAFVWIGEDMSNSFMVESVNERRVIYTA